MCGIVGWIDFQRSLLEPTSINLLKEMNETQIHRGPDGEGFFSSEHLLLGHRRLTIIDPIGGQQPLTRSWKGREYTLVYNGEIYNTPTLRRQLGAEGYPITSHSDTEIVLWTYIHSPGNFLSLLEGMFALAIWDPSVPRLLLARDPLGIKPLFWARIGTGWGFASEVKTLLQHPRIKPSLDSVHLNELWTMCPGHTPGCAPFSTLKEVKPGHKLSITPHQTTEEPYFFWRGNPPHPDDMETTIQYVNDCLHKIVTEQMAADVPIGAMLSGGIDSSFLCSIAHPWYQKNQGRALPTYSIDDGKYEVHFQASRTQPDTDTRWVEIMSHYLGTHHRRISPSAEEIIDNLSTAAYARDMPGMADIDTSLLLFSRAMGREVSVVLSGEGADEIFGGYPWFRESQEALSRETTPHVFPWMRNASKRISFLRPSWHTRLDPLSYLHERYHEACAEVQSPEGESSRENRLRIITYLTLTRWLPVLLERKDRMTMAASLEARVPFCDAKLVSYLWNVPWSMKNYNGLTKGLLRHICRGLLPDSIRLRPKNPYPRTHNPVYFQAMQKKIASLLNDTTSPLHEFLDPTTVQPLLQPGASPQFAWFGQIMQAPSLLAHWLQLDTWWKRYGVTIQ
ncbi:asparagine synthase (glutamine-hydrolyzing) [Pasteuria penetrans]|uniref:asparagine synthase (glutamine-hydrolyzing) n=1 Tax=Pasteuria penetrans TaxID=86005 RepID=UPI000F9C4CC2|nr:asparagine synthase (glutamine-hydrolyzing) [Pasteuria penetrans]